MTGGTPHDLGHLHIWKKTCSNPPTSAWDHRVAAAVGSQRSWATPGSCARPLMLVSRPLWKAIVTGWWLGHPSEKYEFVNWDDDSNPIYEKIKFMATIHQQPGDIYQYLPETKEFRHWFFRQLSTLSTGCPIQHGRTSSGQSFRRSDRDRKGNASGATRKSAEIFTWTSGNGWGMLSTSCVYSIYI